MGRTMRWFKGLFGIKKESGGHTKDKKGQNAIGQTDIEPILGFCNNPTTIPPNISVAEAAWLRSFYWESGKEQNSHAVAVAAATAAAADAAVAAAQAAAAVVRLTSHGRGSMFSGGREMWAALQIQCAFRRFLARKALRALKGLVKLQAAVRGYLVRKQANATFQSMQALIRAQATVRSQRAAAHHLNKFSQDSDYEPQVCSYCMSQERFDDTRSDRTASVHSRRLSSTLDTATLYTSDETAKIVEVDTGRQNSTRSPRTKTWDSDFSYDPHYQSVSSPLLCQVPGHLSIPERRNLFEYSDGDEYRFSTAQSTPRFLNSSGRANAPVTPSKSVCADNLMRYYVNSPNYMATTKSFNAKSRSQSAPKQRPETGFKKGVSLNEVMESRNSLSGPRMQRSCSRVQEAIGFKNAVMARLNRSREFSRDSEKDGLQTRR